MQSAQSVEALSNPIDGNTQADVSYVGMGKQFAMDWIKGEVALEATRLNDFFSIAIKHLEHSEEIAKGVQAGYIEAGQSANTAKNRASNLRRFCHAWQFGNEQLTTAKTEGKGYHVILDMCSDILKANGAGSNAGRKAGKKDGPAPQGDGKALENALANVAKTEGNIPQKHPEVEVDFDLVKDALLNMPIDLLIESVYILSARARELGEVSLSNDLGSIVLKWDEKTEKTNVEDAALELDAA